MTTITNIVKITNGRQREAVEFLGDVSGMVVVPSYRTVINGRSATVSEWYDEATNDGFEVIEHECDERDC